MHRVQHANQRPFHCAVIPFKGNSNSAGFIDTGQFLGDDKVYVSFEAAKLIAETIGWNGPRARQVLEARIAELEGQVERLQAEVVDERAVSSSIEFLGTKDFIARQKRGPKKKVEA